MDAKTWNHKLTKAQKERILRSLGHSPNLKYRAFDLVPKNVIHDIDYLERLQSTKGRAVTHA